MLRLTRVPIDRELLINLDWGYFVIDLAILQSSI